MKQTLHIFRKDARRLWPQIAVVIVLFAIYAILSPETSLSGMNSLMEWGGIPAALIVLACWTLGASAMHEDAAAQQSPFWLTRPYSRRSLVSAKILFLFAFVFVPLVLSGVILEARSGVSIVTNIGSLLGLSLERSIWLILPALALGAITRSLMEFAGAVCVVAVILAIAEARLSSNWPAFLYLGFWQSPSFAAILPMVALAIAVVGWQYAARRTQWSRGLLLTGVIASGLLIPMNSVALFSLRVMNPGFDTTGIRIAFDQDNPPRWTGLPHCRGVAVSFRAEGLPAGTLLHPIGAVADFTSSRQGTFKVREAQVEDTPDGYREFICSAVGWGYEATLRTSVHFAVVATSPVASFPVRRGAQDAGDAGRCEIVEDVNTQLRCTVAEPVAGTVTAGLEYPGFRLFATGFGDSGSIRLSPVLRQKFDGVTHSTPGGWNFEAALNRTDTRFVLRNERVIGFVSRTLVYPQLDPVWGYGVPPPPRRKGTR